MKVTNLCQWTLNMLPVGCQYYLTCVDQVMLDYGST